MIRKFCDRCGKDVTNDQNQVWNPNPYAALKHDVCSTCYKFVLAAFKTMMLEPARP